MALKSDPRSTGIDLVGSAPWGTHFCLFYHNPQDLLEVLVPYFKAGLEQNEFCMWVVSDVIAMEEAAAALREAVADFDERLLAGQIDILPHTEWYMKGGSFDSQRVLSGWVDKLNDASRAGFAGLRLTGDTFWLEDFQWHDFYQYEAVVDEVLGDYRIMALCTYSLDKCGASEIIDVVANHEFALIKRQGAWEIIESGERRRLQRKLSQEQLRHRQYLDIAAVAIVAVDRQGKVELINQRGCEIFGYREDEIVGRDFGDFLPEHSRAEVGELFERVVAGIEEPASYYEQTVVTKRGEERVVIWHNAAVRDAQGNVTGVISSGEDITERRRRFQLNEALNQINQDINSSLDFDRIMDTVLAKAVDSVGADHGHIAFLEGGSWAVKYAYGSSKLPSDGLLVSSFALAEHVLAIKQPYLIGDAAADPFLDQGLSRDLQVKSAIVLPLKAKETLYGIMCLAFGTPIELGEVYADFAAKLAASISLALENARLFGSEREARGQVQSFAIRLAFLHKVSLALNRETSKEKLLATVLEGAAKLTSAGVGAMVTIDRGVARLVSVYYAPWFEQRCGLDAGLDISGLNLMVERLSAGMESDALRVGDLSSLERPVSLPAGHLPLKGLLLGTFKNAVLGYFLLSHKARGEFTAEDEEIISLLAAQGSVALMNVESYEREHAIAETLQAAFISSVPRRSDLEVGLVYQSAGGLSLLGGDFYDFIEQDDGCLAIAVGDVCGKGLEAAAATVMIKYTLRACLASVRDPGECLGMVNSIVGSQLGAEKFVTLTLLVFDPAHGAIRYASAGHPQPVIYGQGATCPARHLKGIPIGVLPEPRFHSVAIPAQAGSIIILYTDGLTEARRAGGKPLGDKRLVEQALTLLDLPAQQIADRLLATALEYSQNDLRDDIALLVLRLT